MASVAASGLFNALAFAGAGFLFKKMDKGGYEDEIKRHNQATEKLATAKEKWYENEVRNKDRIAEMRRQLSDANADINTTNKALDALRKITHEGRVFTKEPHISDYYEPSDEMKEYQHIAVGVAGLGIGWAGYRLISLAIWG